MICRYLPQTPQIQAKILFCIFLNTTNLNLLTEGRMLEALLTLFCNTVIVRVSTPTTHKHAY